MTKIRFIFLISILLCSAKAYSQTDDEKKYVYCDIVLVENSALAKADYNDTRKYISIVLGKNKTVLGNYKEACNKFESSIDAINYMCNNEWELYNVYSGSAGVNIFHYVFRREIEKFTHEEQQEILKNISEP